MTTFEQGFETVSATSKNLATRASELLSVAKQLQKAAIDGDIPKMRKAVERLSFLGPTIHEALIDAGGTWPFSAEEEQAYLESQYESELVEAMKSEGLSVRQQDECLVVYPVILRVLPSERAIRIDRKRSAKLRPSRVVADLRKMQTKRPRFTSERFLETLYRAYRLLVRRIDLGKTESLSRVYDALTLLPGVAADYDRMDFCRDLYLLDHSGLTATRSGAAYSLPASTGTKGSKAFSFVGPDGEFLTYYGVSFEEATR